MDITPHVNLLKSLRGDRIDYVLLVGEGIDNAFDAGAKSISIIINGDEVSFTDDGVGLTEDRIRSLFSLGDHGAMTTTALGRFGIGIKSQAVNAGNIFEVISTSKDGRVKIFADWRQVLKSGSWKIEDPRWLPALVGSPTGTTITVSDLRTTKTPAGGWQRKIVTDAAERFYPAIAAGYKIIINNELVQTLPEPQMFDVIDRHLALSDGRSAHLRAGILVNPSRLNRVHVAYKHRMIMPGSTLGCGEYGGTSKMFARVQLAGPWHLQKFKNDLTDEDEREELESAVAEAIEPILIKCDSASMSARINEISHLLNETLPPVLRAARPQKQKEKERTSAVRKGKNRSGYVAPEKSNPLGPAKTKQPPQDKLFITFEGVAEQDGVGSFLPGRPHRINFSKDHPDVARLCEHRDQEMVLRALRMIAFAIFEQGREEHLPEPELPLEPFGRRIAALMALQQGETATIAR